MAEIQDKVIFKIQTTDLTNLANKQTGAETVADGDCGYKMYGYKDADGTVQRFLAKDQIVQTARIQNKTNELYIGTESSNFITIKNGSRQIGIGVEPLSILHVLSETGDDEHIKLDVGSATQSIGEVRKIARQINMAVNDVEALFTGTALQLFKGVGWISVTGGAGSTNEALATIAFDSTGVYVVPISGTAGLGTAKDTADKVNFYTDVTADIFTLNLQNKSGSGSVGYPVTVAYSIEYHESIAAV
jgi:hypothetical protein